MALVITRKALQSFTIGDDIKVTIVEIRGSQAKVSIEAPKHLNIQRDDMINNKPKNDGQKNTRT